MIDSRSMLVQNLLARPEMHRQWESDYRTADNKGFYEEAFDYIVDVLKPPPGATFLDAGCGTCAHSVRLARCGFNVHAVDFSESVLNMAHEYVRSNELKDRITLGCESLLELSFPDESFDYILCWWVRTDWHYLCCLTAVFRGSRRNHKKISWDCHKFANSRPASSCILSVAVLSPSWRRPPHDPALRHPFQNVFRDFKTAPCRR